MIKKRIVENITCAILIVFSIKQIIGSLFYLNMIMTMRANPLIAIILLILLVALLVLTIICFRSSKKKPIFIALLIISIILYIIYIIQNFNSLQQLLNIGMGDSTVSNMIINSILEFVNISYIAMFILIITCIRNNVQVD